MISAGFFRSLRNDNKLSDNKICTFKKKYCHGVSQENKRFFVISFLSASSAPPLKYANFIFTLVSPSVVVELKWSLGKGMRRSRNQWREVPFHWITARHAMNGGLGKEFHRKGNSVRRFRPFSEPTDSENWNFLRSSPSQILGFHWPQTGARIPISWKRGFRAPKTPISPRPYKGRKREFSVQQSPFSMCSLVEKKGEFFDRKLPFSRTRGNGGFWTPKPLFQEMGIRAPVWGRGKPHPKSRFLLNSHFSGSSLGAREGAELCERTCFCLLSTFYETLPSKNPSKNLVFTFRWKPLQAPSKNPSKKHLLLKSLLRNLLRRVRLHGPLGVHPTSAVSWPYLWL